MDSWLLSSYDDFLSDILVDAANLWFTTRKVNPHYRRARLKPDQTVDLLRKMLDGTTRPDVDTALENLLKWSVVTRFLGMKTRVQREAFVGHARRYLKMYLPQAGFEIGQTMQYVLTKPCDLQGDTLIMDHPPRLPSVCTPVSTPEPSPFDVLLSERPGQLSRIENSRLRIDTREVVRQEPPGDACVIATKPWSAGDIITCCSGAIAWLDDEDTKRFEKVNSDFSVMWWARRQSMGLFLGPARFVNHDCHPNCRFIPMPGQTVSFRVVRDIAVGEEITTSYGDDYFGFKNGDCLCASCQKLGLGAFQSTPAPPSEVPLPSPRLSPSPSVSSWTDMSTPLSEEPGLVSRRPQRHSRRAPTAYSGFTSGFGRKRRRSSRSPASATPVTSRCATCTYPYNYCLLPDPPSSSCTRCVRHYWLFRLPWPQRTGSLLTDREMLHILYSRKALSDVMGTATNNNSLPEKKPRLISKISKGTESTPARRGIGAKTDSHPSSKFDTSSTPTKLVKGAIPRSTKRQRVLSSSVDQPVKVDDLSLVPRLPDPVRLDLHRLIEQSEFPYGAFCHPGDLIPGVPVLLPNRKSCARSTSRLTPGIILRMTSDTPPSAVVYVFHKGRNMNCCLTDLTPFDPSQCTFTSHCFLTKQVGNTQQRPSGDRKDPIHTLAYRMALAYFDLKFGTLSLPYEALDKYFLGVSLDHFLDTVNLTTLSHSVSRGICTRNCSQAINVVSEDNSESPLTQNENHFGDFIRQCYIPNYLYIPRDFVHVRDTRSSLGYYQALVLQASLWTEGQYTGLRYLVRSLDNTIGEKWVSPLHLTTPNTLCFTSPR
ncbi:histone lysine methyltransferase Set9 [Dispira simplex]|nr:histone lysine methyltransferase Set9 [Dispira simplex]